jgi:hypothetical protein
VLTPDDRKALRGLQNEIAALNNHLAKIVKSQEESAEERRQKPTHKPNDRAIPSVPAKESDGASQPTTDPANKKIGPNPWLEFAVQCALCLFTLGAFIAAAYYAYTADQTLTSIRQQTAYAGSGAQGTIDAANAAAVGASGTILAANAARKSADVADRSLEVTERPWIDVNVTINSVLSVSEKSVAVNIITQAHNIGHSVAAGVIMRSKMVLFKEPRNTPVDAQKEMCKEAAGILGKEGSAAETIFPDKSGVKWNGGFSASTDNMNPMTVIVPYLVGCVDYGSVITKHRYQTGFMYEVMAIGPGGQSYVIPRTVGTINQNALVLYPSITWVGGNFAN